MSRDASSKERDVNEIKSRRVTLSDGRYLIFYTFGEETAPDSSTVDAEQPEQQPRPIQTEERHV